MVEKLSKHHVLSPVEQELLDRTLIKETLKDHNLKESVDIVYKMACECMNCSDKEHIDDCLRQAIVGFTKQQKDNESNGQPRKDIFQFPVSTD